MKKAKEKWGICTCHKPHKLYYETFGKDRLTNQQFYKNKCFTLMELLIVITIIAILASMLLPALKTAKDAGVSIVCRGQMKTIAQAQLMYTMDYNGYFLGAGNGHSMYAGPMLPATNSSGYPMKNAYRRGGKMFTSTTSSMGSVYGYQWLPGLAWLYLEKNSAVLFCPGDKRPDLYPQWDQTSSYQALTSWSVNFRYPTAISGGATGDTTWNPHEKIEYILKPSQMSFVFDTFDGKPIGSNGFYFQNGVPISYLPNERIYSGSGLTIPFRRSHPNHYNFGFVDGHAGKMTVSQLMTTPGKDFLYYVRYK